MPTTVELVTLTLLAHPDPRRVGERVALPALRQGERVTLSRIEPLFRPPRGGTGRPLADPRLSRRGLSLEAAADGGVEIHRGDVRTPVEIDGRLLESVARVPVEALAEGVTLVLAHRVALLLHVRPSSLAREGPDHGLVGESAAMERMREQIDEVAPHAVPVLLRGETGTGKELVAQAIHRASPRRDEPWVCVNMGAIPSTLASAELFGAVRGAFTGADRERRGFFRRADKGSLFLDEIGEAPPEVQVLLLRTLETREVLPVGSSVPIRTDTRVIAATDAALEHAIATGTFRAPLLHRLAGYEVHLPSLSSRREDIGRLLVHFLGEALAVVGADDRLAPVGPHEEAWLAPRVVASLARASWPGNVRQLHNLAHQLAIACRARPQLVLDRPVGLTLRERDAVPPVAPIGVAPTVVEAPAGGRGTEAAPPVPVPGVASPRTLDDDTLRAALKAHGYRVRRAAAALGISPTTLYRKIEGSSLLRKAGDLTREEIAHGADACAGDLDAMAAALEVSRKGLRRRMTDLGFA